MMLTVRARRLILLLAALTALLLAGITVGTTPAAHASGAQNRARPPTPAGRPLPRTQTPGSPCSRPSSTVSAAQLVAGFCVATKDAAGESGVIFRGGSQTDNALTDKGSGLSFRDSLSNPANPDQAVLRPGEKYFGVDTSRLPPGSVVRDNVPPGHVSVNGLTPDQIRQAILDPGGDPFLGGKFPR